jgi:hypothetical protein
VAAVIIVKRLVFRIVARRRGYVGYRGFGPCGQGGGGGFDGHHRGWGGGGGFRGFGRGPRVWLRSLFVRLETSPSQEKVIVAAITDLKETAARARERAPEVRDDVSRAIRGEVLDESALGSAQAKVDIATSEVRVAIADALRKIHEVLDAKQREMIADWLARGGGRALFGGAGPYRSVSI